MWLGVSLDTTSGSTSHNRILACAHLWIDSRYRDRYDTDIYLSNGACYEIDGDLDFASAIKILPLTKEGKQISPAGVYHYAMGQAGISASYTPDGGVAVVGAVGVLDWKGAFAVVPRGGRGLTITEAPPEIPKGSYMGYAVTSGIFTHERITWFAAGAPRLNQSGAVLLFQHHPSAMLDSGDSPSAILAPPRTVPLGSYFGAALAAADVDGDGVDELFVGAPMFSSVHEEGKVFVYKSDGYGLLSLSGFLSGRGSPRSRFGTTIVSPGDLDADGYKDVLVGAPFENQGHGVVYVFNGGRDGVAAASQVIDAAANWGQGLKGFGWSISRGVDVDGDGHPEVGVGAYNSNTVVVLSTKPVANVEMALTLDRNVIAMNETDCERSGENVTCVKVQLCFIYDGIRVPDEVGIDITLKADAGFHYDFPLSRARIFDSPSGRLTQSDSRSLRLQKSRRFCLASEVHLRRSVSDFVSPLQLQANFSQSDPSAVAILNRTLPTTVTRRVWFARDCGPDNMCLTDVQLEGEVLLPKDKTLTLGVTQKVVLHFRVFNDGEDAFRTILHVSFPASVQYINVRVAGTRKKVSCETDIQIRNRTYPLLCDIDNPLRRRQSRTFDVELDVSGVETDKEVLPLMAEVTTSSAQQLETLSNNRFLTRLAIRREVDIGVYGSVNPEAIVFYQDQYNATKHQQQEIDDLLEVVPSKASSRTSNILSLSHEFIIENAGRSPLPVLHFSFSIPRLPFGASVPHVLVHSPNVASGLDAQELCVLEAVLHDRILQLDILSRANVTYPRISARLRYECDANTLCWRVRCSFGDVLPGHIFSISIRNDLAVAALDNLTDSGVVYLDVVATTRVTTPMTTTSATRSVERETALEVTLVPFALTLVSWWVVLLSVALGLLLLAALVLLLQRLGFFRRKYREELLRLLDEANDDETWGADACANRPMTGVDGGAINVNILNGKTPSDETLPSDALLSTQKNFIQ